jgi:peptidoglycan/LPS O-acetylase OafA/YrhL
LAGRLEAPGFSLHGANAFLAAGELLFQPNTAVIFFYVLSGFVLSGSLRRRNIPLGRQTLGFVIRRVGRMVPAMWLSVLVAVLVFATIPRNPIEGATPWLNAITQTRIDIGDVLANFAGVRTDINGVLWSVQIELVIAPFLPILVWLADRARGWTIAPTFVVLCVASLTLWSVAPNAVLYAYCFYLGIVLPRLLAHELMASIVRSPLVLVVGLAVLLPVEWAYCTARLWLPYKFIIDAIVSAEVLGFVLLRPAGTIGLLLKRGPLVTLGNLSYSFYVFHFPVLTVSSVAVLSLLPDGILKNAWAATAVTIVLAVGAVAVTLAISALCYVTIERRGTEWGRRFGARVEQRQRFDRATVLP